MEWFDDPGRPRRATLGYGPRRGVRVVLAWDLAEGGRNSPIDPWDGPPRIDDHWDLRSATPPPAFRSRRHIASTALAPSSGLRSSALLDDEFDPRRLVRHPVTVLDLGRTGIHVILNVEPARDRNLWLGLEEGSTVVWSKIVLRSLSQPSLGTFLARFSFAGNCPYELIRRALVGPPMGLTTSR